MYHWATIKVLWVAIPALSALLYMALLYMRLHPRSADEPAARWQVYFLIAASFWSLGAMLLYAAPQIPKPDILVEIVAIANFAMPLTIYAFVAHYLAHRTAQRLIPFGVALYLVVVLLILSGYVVENVRMMGGVITQASGPAMPLVAFYWVLYMYTAGYLVWRELRRAKNAEYRQRLTYLFAAIVLLVLGNTLNVTPLRMYPLESLFAALSALLMALSMMPNHVLSVQTTLKRTVAFIVAALVYIVSVSTVLYLLAQLASWAVLVSSVSIAVLSAILILSYGPLRRRVFDIIEHTFLVDYDFNRLLYALTEISTHLRLPQELGEDILHEIQKTFNLANAALVLKSDRSSVYEVVATVGLPPDAHAIRFDADSPLIHILAQRVSGLAFGELVEIPTGHALWIKEWDALRALGTEAIIPIHAEDGLIGFLILGPRKSGVPYSQRELRETFVHLARQIAIAVDNSRLYAQVQVEAELLARANEELRELDKMKTELIQNVSHELRTPLTLIQGYAELLAQGLMESTDEIREAGSVILQHAQHLRHLVEQLLAFQRLEQAEMPKQPLDVGQWLDEIAKAWQPSLEKAGLHLVLDVRKPLAPVLGNPEYLRQVVDNLLDNARKFSPAGGTITLRAWQRGSEVCISVKDEGIGVPPEKLDRLFERFYQVDGSATRRFGGMGIGLALCKEIIERHKGRIWAESEGPGKGLTVTFTLPVATEQPAPSEKMNAVAAQLSK